MAVDENEAERNRFIAQPSSFTPSGGAYRNYRSDGSMILFFINLFHFLFFSGSLGLIIHNYFVLSAGSGSFWNWVFVGIGSFALWVLVTLKLKL